MQRRDFIACSILGSGALALCGELAGATTGVVSAPADPMLLIATAEFQQACDALQSGRAAAGLPKAVEITLRGSQLARYDTLAATVRACPGHRLVALLDDSGDVMLNEILRSVRPEVLTTTARMTPIDESSANLRISRRAIATGAA